MSHINHFVCPFVCAQRVIMISPRALERQNKVTAVRGLAAAKLSKMCGEFVIAEEARTFEASSLEI